VQESLTQVSPNSLGNPDVLWAVLLWAGALAALVAGLVFRGAGSSRRRRCAAVGLVLFVASPFVQALLANLIAWVRTGRPFPEGLLWGPVWYPPLVGLVAGAVTLLWLWVRGRLGGGSEEPV